MNPHFKVNISCFNIFDFDMNLYFDVIYSPYLYFNLPFGFASPATQVEHNLHLTLGYSLLKCKDYYVDAA